MLTTPASSIQLRFVLTELPALSATSNGVFVAAADGASIDDVAAASANGVLKVIALSASTDDVAEATVSVTVTFGNNVAKLL